MRFIGRIRLRWLLLLIVACASGVAADLKWMQTARVFLIDAYEPPFATRLEYDASALVGTMAAMHANTVRIATMGKFALIPGVRFTPHPELGSRDILAETIAAARPLGIRVVPYVSTGHKLAWSMVTRDHPEYAQRTRPGGGPARSHMYTGEDHGTVCWNTPYRQAYLDMVEHIVRDYQIDGIYFDTWRIDYFWPGHKVCYCDGCRNGFRKLTGKELPWHERDADYTREDLALIDRYHAWQQDELVEIARQVRRIVKSHRDIPLIYNINDPVKMATEDPRILELMDAFLYERGSSILERAEGVSLARAAGLGVWPYVGSYNNWPRTIFNGFDFSQQIFTTTMFGGAPILALPWGYVGHHENRRYAADPFRVIAEHEDDFAGFTNYPYVATVYARKDAPGTAHKGWWWKVDARSSSLGAFAACLYGHVQVTSAPESLLDDAAKMRRYRAIYLADVAELPAGRVENIRQYVREGGGLVVSYATPLAGDLVRAAPFEPAGELAETIENYTSMTGGPFDLYYGEHGRRPVIDQLVPLWYFQPVRALDGGDVWMDIVTGEGPRAILPGVVVSKYGKGRVVYSASALESLFLQENSSAGGEMIRRMVAKAAGDAAPYEIAAPAALLANLTTRGDTWVLHLTNWTGNKLEREGADEYYLAPVENVRIRIRPPEGKRAGSVGLLVPAAHRESKKDGVLEITLPRVEAYQAVRVAWE